MTQDSLVGGAQAGVQFFQPESASRIICWGTGGAGFRLTGHHSAAGPDPLLRPRGTKRMRRFPTGVPDSSVRGERQRKAPKPEISSRVPSVMAETSSRITRHARRTNFTACRTSRPSSNCGSLSRMRSIISLIFIALRLRTLVPCVDMFGSIPSSPAAVSGRTLWLPGNEVRRWLSVPGCEEGNLRRGLQAPNHRRPSRNSCSRAKCMAQEVSLNRGIRNNCAARLAEAGCV